jgi:hypothetical protein
VFYHEAQRHAGFAAYQPFHPQPFIGDIRRLTGPARG